jgi:hypothetical protein
LWSTELYEEIYGGIEPILAEVIQKSCRRKPEDRYQNTAEMINGLAAVRDHLPDTGKGKAWLCTLLPEVDDSFTDLTPSGDFVINSAAPVGPRTAAPGIQRNGNLTYADGLDISPMGRSQNTMDPEFIGQSDTPPPAPVRHPNGAANRGGPAPTRCGPYALRERLGLGGQANVWLADGPRGEVALKMGARGSLTLEAQLLQMAEHEGLVRLLDKARDGTWMAMEYIDGRPLHEWAEGRSIVEIMPAFAQLCEVLAHLHDQGVIHGDLKPDHVLLDDTDHVRLIDLGISILGHVERRRFRGTFGYAAPEMLKGQRPGNPTDLYGLGATFYHALTGRTPFVAADPAALAYVPLVSIPLPPSAFRVDIPPQLDNIVLQLLTRAPSRRPQSARAVRDALLKVGAARDTLPVVGMTEMRDEMMRAVVGASDGETRSVVIYGPPGSGRKTVISEAIAAARREGMKYVKASQLRQQIRESDGRFVTALNATQTGAVELCRLMLRSNAPALMLLRSEKPIPSLGNKVIQLTPPPLAQRDIFLLCKAAGSEPGEADDWLVCKGQPASVLARLRPAGTETVHLPAASRKILQALAKRPKKVEDLAFRLKMGQHQLLDYCEVLFNEGRITASPDGSELRVVRS